HRGRAKVHALQKDLRQRAVDEGKKSIKAFWDFYRALMDPRPQKSRVGLDELSDDFLARLNYPVVPPETFNTDQLDFNAEMVELLVHEPVDNSPRLSFTRDIELEDIEDVKRHIKSHNLGSS
ncbi:hypothetical protein C8F01DRAFT_936526, partial [Mycena amicta]